MSVKTTNLSAAALLLNQKIVADRRFAAITRAIILAEYYPFTF
jgi:hypothetical protein